MSSSELIMNEDIAEELFQIRKYEPLSIESITQQYINNLFLSGVYNNGFYNNLYLNLYHFYIFIMHTFLVKAYKLHLDDTSIKILQKVKTIGKKIKTELEIKKLRHEAFKTIEKDSIKHLCYLLDLEEDSNLIKRHSEIFKLRDIISHFNEESLTEEKLLEYIEKIGANLSCISEKMYQDIKLLLDSNLQECIDNKVIDKDNYVAYFEEWNYELYLSMQDYQMILDNGYLVEIKKSTPKFYMEKYIKEELGLESE